jgi:hypothetical protein
MLRSILFFAFLMFISVPTHADLPPEVAALVKETEAFAPTAKAKFAVDEKVSAEWKGKAEHYMSLPAAQVTAHPTSADFPGSVPADAPRVKREFTLPLNMPRWQSTGLYAAPGDRVTVEVNAEDAARGLSIVIGAHRDRIFAREKWPRFPLISRSFTITETKTVIANAFGGLIYIDVSRDKAMGGYNVPTYGGYGWLNETPNEVKGSVHVSIEGGVESPHFQAGRTTAEQWKTLKQSPAPWGELATEKIILTLPSDVLRTIEDPAALLAFWDEVIDAEDFLAGWPARARPPERIVIDRETSAGYMHSGYPVMCQMAGMADLIDLGKLKDKGGWGFFHELGHNHEPQACTFGPDYVEVVVNFFSLYVNDKVVKQEMTAGHPALKDVDKLLHARLGPSQTKGPFENLAMYILPIKALGWEPFQKTLASYSAREGAAGIKSREDKMDQWVLRYSQATGRSLVSYFAAFEITCTEQTKEAVANLPVWLPEDGFPKKYLEP